MMECKSSYLRTVISKEGKLQAFAELMVCLHSENLEEVLVSALNVTHKLFFALYSCCKVSNIFHIYVNRCKTPLKCLSLSCVVFCTFCAEWISVNLTQTMLLPFIFNCASARYQLGWDYSITARGPTPHDKFVNVSSLNSISKGFLW